MGKFYKYILLSRNLIATIVTIVMVHNISFAQYSPNPQIKVNYSIDSGMMKAFVAGSITTTGGSCAENGLEIRIHTIFNSSTGPVINSSYCNTYGTGPTDKWSCEFRTETCSNAGKCGVWFRTPNCLSNSSFVFDPGYTDTSSYPCTDILSIRLKGFETDNGTFSFLNGDKVNYNLNDGACGGTCASPSCYGEPQIPTGGIKNMSIDVGSATNTLLPFCGSVWSQNYQTDLETSACTSDGLTNYYYIKWKYRWCWDATTLFDRHAGGINELALKDYCSGATISISDSIEGFEVSRGFASYQWEKNSGSGWSDITGATSKDLATTSLTNFTVNPITYQIRRATLFCTDFLTTPTKTRVYSNITTVNVYPQPVAPTLYVAGTSPATGTIICKGLFVYAQFNSGTGGYSDANDLYQYSINNGATWNNYTPGNSINTAAAITEVLVRVARTAGSLSSCNATSWTTLVNWPLSTVATPPSITTALPANNTAVCLAGTSGISCDISEGLGGTGYEYGYSINNGTTPTSTFTGTPPSSSFTINTTGATTKINLFTRRTGVGVGTCNPTPWALIGEWKIVNEPVSPSINTKDPAASSIAEGETVSATANNGSGGAADAVDEYRISSDNGGSWNTYNIGDNEIVPIAATKMIIQGRRISGTSYGCTNSSWFELASWNVDVVLPVELISFTAHNNGFVNQIEWSTASEINTKEFIVLKSTTFNNWLEIGNIQAFGNSTNTQSYYFDDNNLQNLFNYYKLKIVDYDNSYEYSNVISVNNISVKKDNISLFPNPTDAIIKLTSVSGFTQYSLIKITDIVGKITKEIKLDNNNKIANIDIDCSSFSSGSYYVCIYDTFGGLIKTIKFVKY